MDFGIAIALGVLGSLHCAAMCGPLLLALPVSSGQPGRFLAGRMVYQLGRISTYCLLGVIAGLLGKSVFVAGLQRWISIVLGVAILAGFLLAKKFAVSAPVTRMVLQLKTA
ncbi:MAG TPA: sulfite exporter TauE/SafE family protein, partial [Verrucomicrobiae bacterium]